MKKFLFLFMGLIFLFSFKPLVAAEEPVVQASASVAKKEDIKEEWPDPRLIKLASYLKKEHSPLWNQSWRFILAADNWEIDWRLLPAIAGLESLYGKRMIPGSFNAYGWGGGHIYFKNWSGSISYLAMSLRSDYYNQGLREPESIGKVYAPPNPSWGKLVKKIMTRID